MIIDVYQFRLSTNSEEVRAAEAVLSEDEVARFSRMVLPWRNRRIVARAVLRWLLGQRMGIHPRDVLFDYGEHGKPRLAQKFGGDIRFNLAHSSDLVVIVIGNGVAIGVDLEEMKDEADFELIAREVFSSHELAAFHETPADRRRHAFYRAWTRKEAFVKATGEGIARPFCTFEVSFDEESDARLLTVPAEWGSKPWSLVNLTTAPNFCGAIAAGSPRVIAWHHKVNDAFTLC